MKDKCFAYSETVNADNSITYSCTALEHMTCARHKAKCVFYKTSQEFADDARIAKIKAARAGYEGGRRVYS